MMESQLSPAEFEEALAKGRSLLDAAPAAALEQALLVLRAGSDPRALRLAAAAYRRLGSVVEAERSELAAIDASLQHPELRRAVAAGQQGQSGLARSLADEFLRKEPDDLLALVVSAEGAIATWQLEEAEAQLREVTARAPAFLRGSMLLAKCLAMQMRVREAIAVLEAVTQGELPPPPVTRYLARLHADIGDYERTIALYKRVLDAPDARANDWVSYAQYLRIAGRRDDSLAAFRRALRLDPRTAAAWWAISHFFPDDLGERDIATIQRLAANSAVPQIDAGLLHVALFNIADRRGEHADAFRQLTAASRCRPRKPYDPGILGAELNDVIRNFTPALYRARSSAGSADRSPIFVVGLPRSGSTLVERILGRHSMLEGAGEIPVMGRLVEQLSRRAPAGTSYSAFVAALPDEELARLGEAYLERAREFRRTDKPMFVDKLNGNWMNAGLIRLILPNARILDVRRDALDCCWSNFKMQFGDGYAGDLRHLARYYLDYVRFIDRIDAAAPGGILRVGYEELVTDVEAATRRMLGFVGLDFEPACVSFHLSEDPVATPSSEQVRTPLHSGGIGAADPYRCWLGPLIEELGPLARRG